MIWRTHRKEIDALTDWLKEHEARISRVELKIEKIEARRKSPILRKEDEGEETEDNKKNDGLDSFRRASRGQESTDPIGF